MGSPDASPPSVLWSAMTPADATPRDDLCAVSAEGFRIHYADGSHRLDGTSGLWNVPLGYGNVAIADAVSDAMRTMSYLGTYQTEHVLARRAADALLQVAGAADYERVVFATSGGSANDMVLKIVRQYHMLLGDSSRDGIVALDGCWHGLTFGAFALTSDRLGQPMYRVDRRLVVHVAPNDNEALDRVLDEHATRIAALVVEPVLGTGAVALQRAYVDRLLAARRKHGVLLVADEVATGFARTGPYFASQDWPEAPDILIISKALTNGTCAAAAVVVGHRVASLFRRFGATLAHGETQAGTAVTCAAILATIEEMERLDVVARSSLLAVTLDAALEDFVKAEPLAAELTGVGCMRSVRLRHDDGSTLDGHDVNEVIECIRSAGANVHSAPSGIAVLPALLYSAADVAELLDAVRSGFAAYRASRGGSEAVR